MAQVHEIRLADCHRLGREVHLKPGDGDLDFADLFRRVESKGYCGRYTCAFGTLEDMLEGREELVRAAAQAGIR
jgi:sugar phosphate isomerase/epimerase